MRLPRQRRTHRWLSDGSLGKLQRRLERRWRRRVCPILRAAAGHTLPGVVSIAAALSLRSELRVRPALLRRSGPLRNCRVCIRRLRLETRCRGRTRFKCRFRSGWRHGCRVRFRLGMRLPACARWCRRRRRRLRHILHEIAQRWRRSRLHAFPRPRQNIIGDRRLSGGGALWRRCRRQRLLERANRAVERQSMRLQNIRGETAPIADDRSENDGPVDVAPSTATRSRGSRFKDAPHVR